MNSPKYDIDLITCGYNLPLQEHCPPFFAKNNTSSLHHSAFAEQAITELFRIGCIVETLSLPHCCNPLTVSELRLILDLRYVNAYLVTTAGKIRALERRGENIPTMLLFCINPAHQNYLFLSWTHTNVDVRYYFFAVMLINFLFCIYQTYEAAGKKVEIPGISHFQLPRRRYIWLSI